MLCFCIVPSLYFDNETIRLRHFSYQMHKMYSLCYLRQFSSKLLYSALLNCSRMLNVKYKI